MLRMCLCFACALLLGRPVVGISGGIPIAIQRSLLLKTGREEHGVFTERGTTESHVSTSAVLSVLLSVLLALTLLALTLLILAALHRSTATVLHALDLGDCGIKRARAGSSNHGARQRTIGNAMGIGALATVLGLVKAEELLSLSHAVLLTKGHAGVVDRRHFTTAALAIAITAAPAASVLIPASLVHAVLAGHHLSTNAREKIRV